MKNDDDDDFDTIDDEDTDSNIDVESISMSHRSARGRRGWRDIERMREQKEIERLMGDDDWFDDLDRA